MKQVSASSHQTQTVKSPAMHQLEPAPMAGFTDRAFRRVLIKCGARVTWTEMVSVTALFYNNKKTKDLLTHDKKTIVQIFGKNPSHFEHVLKSGLLDEFAEININMGCPASKIVKNGEGCALMNKPELARQIIETCVKSAKKPISVKFRLGCSAPSGNNKQTADSTCETTSAVLFAKMCEDAGACRIIVHGRFGSQGYSGIADWNAIAKVVRAVKIPVIANGDIKNKENARECIIQTGAAGVMIGRALLGSPWRISKQEISERKIKSLIKYHLKQSIKCHGEGSILEMRKHLLLYANHLNGGKEMKKRLAVCKSFDEAKEIMKL